MFQGRESWRSRLSLMAGRSSNTKSSTSPGKKGTVEKKVRRLKETNDRLTSIDQVSCLKVRRFCFIMAEDGEVK